MTFLLRAACVAALTPTGHTALSRRDVSNHRESAFVPPARTLPIRSGISTKPSWTGTNGDYSTASNTVACPRSHQPSPRGCRRGRTCHFPGGGLTMMVTTSGDRAGTQAEDAIFRSIESPAAAELAAKGMRQDEWEALLATGEVLSLREGELLMSEGDSYDEPDQREVYLVVGGELRLEVQGKSVARLKPGEFVGEGVVLQQQQL